MDFPTTFAEARAAHPAAVQAILAEQAASRSQYRETPPEELRWRYAVALRMEAATSFQAIIARAATPRPPFLPAATPEERVARIEAQVADQVARTHCCLMASRRQTAWGQVLPPAEFPPALLAQYRTQAEASEAERERIARLTPEERASEEAANLAALRGMPGFVELRVPLPPRPPRPRRSR